MRTPHCRNFIIVWVQKDFSANRLLVVAFEWGIIVGHKADRNSHYVQKRQLGLGQSKQLHSSLHKRFMENDRGFSVLSSTGCVRSWAFLQTTRVKELFMCIYSYCESSMQVFPVLNLFCSQCLNIAQHILCRSIGCKLTKFLF